MTYSTLWNSLSKDIREKIINCNKYYYHKRFYLAHKGDFSLKDYEHFREFCQWVKDNDLESHTVSEIEEETEDFEDTISLNTDEWEHTQSYWYDDKRDIYVVHLNI